MCLLLLENLMDRDLTKYIPHRENMILLDGIVDSSKDGFCAQVNIKETSVLINDGKVPNYVTIEYMAQSVAAAFNTTHYSSEDQPRIGFIIAARSFIANRPYFELGDSLRITVEPVLVVENSGSFVS